MAAANKIYNNEWGFDHKLVYDKELEPFAAETPCGIAYLQNGLAEVGSGGAHTSVNLREEHTRIACVPKKCGGVEVACAVGGPSSMCIIGKIER